MYLTLKNISLKSLVLVILLSHVVLLGVYPLMDTTEARYADIARRMWLLNDWITPWFDDGVPFWGKPPLSFWVTLFGYHVFGVNEFGARFFHWLTSLMVLLVSYRTMRLMTDKKQALFAVAVLSSLTLFYISSTAVMTDMTLLLGGSLVLYGQLMNVKSGRLTWHSLLMMAIGLSIGLLAKGPIALILFMGPMFLMMVWRRQWGGLRELHLWLLLFCLVAAIVTPWYVLAEMKTPGFLEYFLLGEHWQRFVVSGWHGDRYGSAHEFARGSIWFFFVLAALPWSVMLPYLYFKHKMPFDTQSLRQLSPENSLLVLWVVMPMLFFTFSGNVLWTYVMPGFPALAILVAIFLNHKLAPASAERWTKAALVLAVLFKLSYLGALYLSGIIYDKSTKYLLSDLKQKQIALNRVVFLKEVPFSARFYSHGEIKSIESLAEPSKDTSYDYVVMTDKSMKSLHLGNHYRQLMQYGKYHVFHYSVK